MSKRALLGLVVGSISAIAGLIGCGDSGGTEVRTAQQDGPPDSAVAPDGVPIPAGAGAHSVSAWTDAGLFVYSVSGGDGVGEARADSAVLLDASGAEQVGVPDPPFAHPLHYFPAIAVSGEEVFLLGAECHQLVPDPTGGDPVCVPGTISAASYSLTDGTWRPLEIPEEISASEDLITRTVGVSETGEIVFSLQAAGFPPVTDAPFWIFSPAENRWLNLSSPNVVVDDSCLAGDTLVVASSSDPTAGPVDDVRLHTLSLTDQAPGWVTTAPSPGLALSSPPSVACGDTFAIASGLLASEVSGGQGDPQAVVARHPVNASPSEGWSDLPPMPPELAHAGTSIWTGEALILVDVDLGVGAVLDAARGEWTGFDLPTVALVVADPAWTGEHLVVIDPDAEGALREIEVPT